jgi:hypothetical protein
MSPVVPARVRYAHAEVNSLVGFRNVIVKVIADATWLATMFQSLCKILHAAY